MGYIQLFGLNIPHSLWPPLRAQKLMAAAARTKAYGRCCAHRSLCLLLGALLCLLLGALIKLL